MGIELKVGAEYLHKGATVSLVAEADGIAMVQLKDSSHVLPAMVSELSPVPTANEKLHSSMAIKVTDWERAASLATAIDQGFKGEIGLGQLVKSIAADFGVSARQAARYIAKYRENAGPMAFLPQKPGPKVGTRNMAVEMELIIAKNIESDYLREEKPSFDHLYSCISVECRQVDLKPPCKNTIRRRLSILASELKLRRREGAKRAKEKHGSAAGHAPADYPLQRVEIDHTLCDVILVADTPAREVLGRPWLTLAIDVFSRMVVGLYVSFERPSSASIAMCLANALLPKEAWLAANGAVGDWPCQGVMEEIMVDNAMEFRAMALRRGCEQMLIKLQYRPIGSPEMGASIERLIGTVMGRVHLLPGTTQSNTLEKGDYDAEKKAFMTLREFCTWLTEQIVSNYHLNLHKGINKPPIVAWNSHFAESAPKFKGTQLEVLGAFLPAEQRVLRRVGVEFKGGNYWDDKFLKWVGEDRKVAVHYHPLDASHVYVRAPNGELVIAKSFSRTPRDGLTFADVRRRGSQERAPAKDPRIVQKKDESHARMKSLLEESAKRTDAARNTPPAPSAPTTMMSHEAAPRITKSRPARIAQGACA